MFPRARQPRVAFFCRGETRLLRIGRKTRDDVGFDRLAQELGFEDMSDVDPADLGLEGDFDKLYVVSHVPSLRDSFDTTLSVVRDEQGSRVVEAGVFEAVTA